MNQQDHHDLQRWLDGELDEPARAALEARMREDSELRAEAELHRRVGESMQRSFAVPPIAVPRIPAPVQVGRRPWPMFLSGALTAAAVLLLWLQPWEDSAAAQRGSAQGDLGDVEVMRTAVGRSWIAVCDRPDEPSEEPACASPGQVPEYVGALVGDLPSPLIWRPREGVQFQRGVEPRPEDGLRVLELKVLPETEVLLFVVPASTDPHPILPGGTGRNLFRKTCGPLVIYELTPLDEPHGLRCVMEAN